jgi:SulP family sulfate permease
MSQRISLPLPRSFSAQPVNPLAFFLRPIELLTHYQRSDLRHDLLAGLTVAVMLLPQSIAYAVVAELPPQMGIYAAIVAAIVGALWGSSNHLQTGPTNTASLLVLSTLVIVAQPGTPEYLAAAGLLAVMVGVARLVMGLAQMGVLVNFVSDSVIIGFTAGAGVLIGANQLKHLLGISLPSTPALFDTLAGVLQALPQSSLPSLGLGLFTALIILLVAKFLPRWPSALLGMGVAALAAVVLHLPEHGVQVLGEVPRSLPLPAHLPLTDLNLIGQISSGALAISAIGLVEALSIARSIAAQSGQRLDSNQEFVGQGLANIATGFLSGYPCSGSFIRSAVNHRSGGRTPLASVFSGLWVLLALLLFAPLAAYIPNAALAGMILVMALQLINWQEMKRILSSSLGDSVIMLATLLATLLLPLAFAVLAGVIVSLARYLVKSSRPEVYPVVPDENFQHFVRQESHHPCLQLGIITVGGSLFFGAAHQVEEAIRANLERHPEQRYLLLRMNLVDHCDISGVHMLEAIVRLYRQRRGDVFLIVRPAVKELMEINGFVDMLAPENFLTRENAVSTIFHKVLDPSVCLYECPLRVFAECQALPKHPLAEHSLEAVSLPEHHIQHRLPDEVKRLLSPSNHGNGTLLVDVRELEEFREGHIPEARPLPLRLIRTQGPTLPRDHQIILVCRSGRRSTLAATILKDMGYNGVSNLRGGMLAWEAAGYPIAVER